MTAIAKVSGVRINEISDGFALTALASGGKQFEFEGKDGYMALLVTGTAADTITVVAGDGGTADLAVSTEANKYHFITLDSKYFLTTTGDNKGTITVKGASTSSAAVIELAY